MALPTFDYGEDCRDAVRDLACTVAAEVAQENGVTVTVGEWLPTQRYFFPLAFTVNGTDYVVRVSLRSLRFFSVDLRKAAAGDWNAKHCIRRMRDDILRRQMREAVERLLGLPVGEG